MQAVASAQCMPFATVLSCSIRNTNNKSRYAHSRSQQPAFERCRLEVDRITKPKTRPQGSNTSHVACVPCHIWPQTWPHRFVFSGFIVRSLSPVPDQAKLLRVRAGTVTCMVMITVAVSICQRSRIYSLYGRDCVAVCWSALSLGTLSHCFYAIDSYRAMPCFLLTF